MKFVFYNREARQDTYVLITTTNTCGCSEAHTSTPPSPPPLEQVMAALAYSRDTPGIWFIDPQEWVARNLFKAASIWDIPLLKPRYTCTIDSTLQQSEISNADLAPVLKSSLDFFSKGGTCESGLIDTSQMVF